MRKEIAQFLQTGQEAIARIRVEHVIREQNTWAAYEILELFCEFLLARVPIIETQRECPTDLREAIATIIFAAPRCSDVPDLLHIKNLFTTKYGKEFVSAMSELRPDSGVNRTIIEKLSVSPPSGELKLKVLKGIAQEYNLEWDSSDAEAELTKRHEDLLQIGGEAGYSQTPSNQNSVEPSNYNVAPAIAPKKVQQEPQQVQVSKPLTKAPLCGASEVQPSLKDVNYAVPVVDAKREIIPQTSDILEKARAAIAAAERASANARVAAGLATAKFERQSS